MNLPPIVDAHVHLWDPARIDYPWLAGVPALNQAFLPADFSRAAGTTTVEKIIFVEAGCAAGLGLTEAEWISELARQEPRIKGIVAHAPLEKGRDARAGLAALAALPLVKGVRRLLQSESDVDFCLRPNFLAGVELLEEFGFSLDLCLRHEQLPGATELVRQFPRVTFVLDHLGKPDIRGRRPEPWSKDLQALAARPNIVCKISGLATEADHVHWQPADLEFYLARALELFGGERILFGGDWPVATLATSYERWVQTVRKAFSSTGEAGLARLFRTNAERIYHV